MAAESSDDTTQAPSLEGTAAPSQSGALEARIDQLTAAIAAQGDRDGQLSQVVSNLQQQLGRVNQPEAHTPEPSEKFQQFYADPDAYIRQLATESHREVLGPHLANQALQTRDAMLAQARVGVDGEYGDGAWDEHFSKDVLGTLTNLPLEMQSSRQHVEAAISAVLGRQYLMPENAKKLEAKRSKNAKAREEAMNMLPGGRGRPGRPDQLDDRERGFLDSLERSGIPMTEADYKMAKGMSGKSIDDWTAAKAASAPKK